jgi:hypothetical protein
VIRAADAVGTPTAEIAKLSASESKETVLADASMVSVGEECYALDWDIPEDVELKTHFAIITIPLVGDGSREECKEIEIEVDTLAGAAVIGSDQTLFGAFVLEKTTLIRRDMRRILEEGLVEIPRVEVIGTVVSWTRKNIKVGDTPLFEFKQFVEDTKVPLDITGATIRFRARPELTAGPLTWERITTVTDGTQGRHEVRLTAADTVAAGNYDAEVEITLPTAVVLTTPTFTVNIREALG